MKITVLLQKYLLSKHHSIVSNKTRHFTYSQKSEAHQYPVVLALTQISDPLGILRDFQYFFFHVKNITDPKEKHCFTEQPKFSCPQSTDKPKATDDNLHKYFLPWKHFFNIFLKISWGLWGSGLNQEYLQRIPLLAVKDVFVKPTNRNTGLKTFFKSNFKRCLLCRNPGESSPSNWHKICALGSPSEILAEMD